MAEGAVRGMKTYNFFDKPDTLNSPLGDIQKLVKKAGWFMDRDNSMEDVDINDDTPDGLVGRAMATVVSKRGKSQAIQVCPGVYLASAHGVLDSPIKAKEEKRELLLANENYRGLIAYPYSKKNIMRVTAETEFI